MAVDEAPPKARAGTKEARQRAFVLAVGARVRAARRSRGRTLRDVAEPMGTTPQTVQRLETGSITVSLEWVGELCEALGIHPAALFMDEASEMAKAIARADKAEAKLAALLVLIRTATERAEQWEKEE